MSLNLRISLIIGIIFFIIFLVGSLVKKQLNIKYTLLWFFMVAVMFFAVLLPEYVGSIAEKLGFDVPVNFIFVLTGLFTLMILVSMTAIVSHMNERVFRLVQKQALLEKRIHELEKKDSINEL